MNYLAVLRIPGVPAAFTAAVLARLSYGSVSLSLLLTVRRATGSFGAAGAALATFSLLSILLPLKSRLIDRYGRRRVLVPLGLGYAAVLCTVAAVAASGGRAAMPYVVLAALAGLLAAPVGPVMRSVWAAVTPDPAVRARAYALDAVTEKPSWR